MSEIRRLLASVVRGFCGRDLVRMAVLGVIVLVDCSAGTRKLISLGCDDLRRGMVLARPAKQHGGSRQSLQGDSGHDQPSEKQAEAGHDRRILLRLAPLVVAGHDYAHLGGLLRP